MYRFALIPVHLIACKRKTQVERQDENPVGGGALPAGDRAARLSFLGRDRRRLGGPGETPGQEREVQGLDSLLRPLGSGGVHRGAGVSGSLLSHTGGAYGISGRVRLRRVRGDDLQHHRFNSR